MTPATLAARDAILACLLAHAERAMVRLNDVSHHGPGDRRSRALTLWLTRAGGHGRPPRRGALADAPQAVTRDRMADCQLVVLDTLPERARQRVDDSFARFCARGSDVARMGGDIPLAMTGFNAHVPDMVQIGGVHRQPALRGRGPARRALALHLAASGARRAALRSASDAAARASRAIGVRQIGDGTLLLLRDRESV